MELGDIRVVMCRGGEGDAAALLSEVPGDAAQWEVPAGYRLQWYRPGDEHHWVSIQAAADRFNPISLVLFQRHFGSDAAGIDRDELARRQAHPMPRVMMMVCVKVFLVEEASGELVGTSTAWFGNFHGEEGWGRVHWLAVLPRLQGRGLAKPLMCATLRRLSELGCRRAYLVTSAARPSAISLYSLCGFRPDIRSSEDRSVWERVRASGLLRREVVLDEAS